MKYIMKYIYYEILLQNIFISIVIFGKIIYIYIYKIYISYDIWEHKRNNKINQIIELMSSAFL